MGLPLLTKNMESGAPVFDDPVILPIEDSLDLHTFAPREISSVVEAYLAEAVRRGFREVRLIHGKGRGAQRATLRALLARHPLVARYADAPPERGGWGATVVFLKGLEADREPAGD